MLNVFLKPLIPFWALKVKDILKTPSCFFFSGRFDIQPKSGSKMVWRPNQIQLTGLRATNIASFFMSQDLDSCGTLDKAGLEGVKGSVSLLLMLFSLAC